MAALGKNQRAVLEAVRDGKATIHHGGQGAMHIFIPERVFDNARFVDRLFDLGYVKLGDSTGPVRYQLCLTSLGQKTLETS